MRLIYLSPVPWDSFSQRPHKFVEWFHDRYDSDVLWLDPYPTRFPNPLDLSRLKPATDIVTSPKPSWLSVLKPFSLPIEPLPGSGWINSLCYRRIFKCIQDFVRHDETRIVAGKPSVLALTIINRFASTPAFYDVMDDFPAFYRGISRYSMAQRESRLAAQVKGMFVSSSALKDRWSPIRADVQFVPNGFDGNLKTGSQKKPSTRNNKIFGYVGTIGPWFDWKWVIELALMRPDDLIRIIGPLFVHSGQVLPNNIELLPQCSHQEAIDAMCHFDAGLIPFKKNELTLSVDPIKYYEYRTIGLPVISTRFGEMAYRDHDKGVFLADTISEIQDILEKIGGYVSDEAQSLAFQQNNTWEARFNSIRW